MEYYDQEPVELEDPLLRSSGDNGSSENELIPIEENETVQVVSKNDLGTLMVLKNRLNEIL